MGMLMGRVGKDEGAERVVDFQGVGEAEIGSHQGDDGHQNTGEEQIEQALPEGKLFAGKHESRHGSYREGQSGRESRNNNAVEVEPRQARNREGVKVVHELPDLRQGEGFQLEFQIGFETRNQQPDQGQKRKSEEKAQNQPFGGGAEDSPAGVLCFNDDGHLEAPPVYSIYWESSSAEVRRPTVLRMSTIMMRPSITSVALIEAGLAVAQCTEALVEHNAQHGCAIRRAAVGEQKSGFKMAQAVGHRQGSCGNQYFLDHRNGNVQLLLEHGCAVDLGGLVQAFGNRHYRGENNNHEIADIKYLLDDYRRQRGTDFAQPVAGEFLQADGNEKLIDRAVLGVVQGLPHHGDSHLRNNVRQEIDSAQKPPSSRAARKD